MKNNWAFFPNLSPQRYEVNQKSRFWTKNPKINPLVVKSPLESNGERFRQSAIRENFSLKPETIHKKLVPITVAFLPIITKKWRRSCNQFLPFVSEPNLSTKSKTCMHLKNFQVFFRSSQTRNTLQARAGPPTSSCINSLFQHLSKQYFYSIWSRTSKDS